MIRTKSLFTVAACCAAFVLAAATLDAAFSALCGGGTSCAYVSGDRFGYQTVEKIRQNFNALVAAPYWTSSADSNLSSEVNLGALSTGLVKITVSGSTATPSTATAGTDYSSPSSADTVTNKTINAESTGNVITLSVIQYFTAAVCESDTPYTPGWSFSASGNSVTSECATGTNTVIGLADFVDGGTSYLQNSIRLPADWTGAVGMNLYWLSSATSGNVVWQIQTACAGDGELPDQSWNAAQTVTDATKASGGQENTASFPALTMTGCAAGEMFMFKLLRDPAHASDTLGDTAKLVGVELVYRRAI